MTAHLEDASRYEANFATHYLKSFPHPAPSELLVWSYPS